MEKIVNIVDSKEFKLFWKILEVLIAGLVFWLFSTMNQLTHDVSKLQFQQENIMSLRDDIKEMKQIIKSQNDLLIEMRIKMELQKKNELSK
jgi:hypothetical protein